MKKKSVLIFLSIIVVLVSVITGIVTRNSYQTFDTSEATYSVPYDKKDNYERDLPTLSEVKKEIKEAQNIFVVEIKEHEQSFKETRTHATVLNVVKGDNSLLGEEILIYEPNFFTYDKENDEYWYYSINNLNSIMGEGKKYLVFVNTVNYDTKYEEQLLMKEFCVTDYQSDYDPILYSFPLDEKIAYLDGEKATSYDYVSDYDWLCYTEEQAKLLEEIRQTIIEKYLWE